MTDLLKEINYELPTMLKESVAFSDLVHMVQLQDILENKFNQITFIGNYSKILKEQNENIYKMNTHIKEDTCSVFLNNSIPVDKFRPNHTTNYYKYQVCDDFSQLYNGMMKCNDFYILINTENENLKYSVYAVAEATSIHTPVKYCCFVFIGKIINPTPYTKDEVEIFEKFNNLNLSNKLKDYLTTKPKVYFAPVTKKLYFINLFGNFPNLSKKFSKTSDNYDIEHFRPLLNEVYENQLLEENYDINKDNNYQKIMDDLKDELDHFYDGFIKLGTILNDEKEKSTVDFYLLLNSDEKDDGTIWINENLPDPTGKDDSFINYLPVKNMKKSDRLYE